MFWTKKETPKPVEPERNLEMVAKVKEKILSLHRKEKIKQDYHMYGIYVESLSYSIGKISALSIKTYSFYDGDKWNYGVVVDKSGMGLTKEDEKEIWHFLGKLYVEQAKKEKEKRAKKSLLYLGK